MELSSDEVAKMQAELKALRMLPVIQARKTDSSNDLSVRWRKKMSVESLSSFAAHTIHPSPETSKRPPIVHIAHIANRHRKKAVSNWWKSSRCGHTVSTAVYPWRSTSPTFILPKRIRKNSYLKSSKTTKKVTVLLKTYVFLGPTLKKCGVWTNMRKFPINYTFPIGMEALKHMEIICTLSV